MNMEELRGKTPDQLRTQLVDLKREQFNLRFQKASGQLENTARVRDVRRTIARIQTMLNQGAPARPEPQVAARKEPPAKARRRRAVTERKR